MANTYTNLQYHIIFSTKHREPWISHEHESRLWEFLGGIARAHRVVPLQIGGTDDHIHMLLGLRPTMALSDAVKFIKGGSSGWVKESLPRSSGFAWQDGYAAFSVSKSQVGDVKAYILGQREHHRYKTFQEEYRAFLDKHGIPYEERYLWD